MSNPTLTPSGEAASLNMRPGFRPGWLAVFLLALCVFGAAAFARLQRHNAAVSYSDEAAIAKPVVSTVQSSLAPATAELILPGNTEAVVVSDIYARATGYVKSRRVDIGDRVKAGQLLAEIESPEIDQELAGSRATREQARAAWRQAQANVTRAEEGVVEARARLEQSQANETLASNTSERWTRLVDRGVLPRQEGDEKQFAYSARRAEVAATQASIKTAEATVNAARASVLAAESTLHANEANVTRWERLVAFERVVAPFDGIITERLVEQGALISSGGVSGGRKLFAIAQPSILRVRVNVPQLFAADVQTGQEAQLSLRERPGVTLVGKVVRTANALNASSRTLPVEVQVDNRETAFLPGMFAEVKFSVPRSKPSTVIPADALMVNAQGSRVAVVDSQGRIHLRSVEVGRDLGAQIELVSGIEPHQSVVLNPGEMLAEGQEVEVSKPANEQK